MTIVQKYQVVVFFLVIIINVLLVANGILILKLRKKDMDKKIERCRRAQKRMEEHPKRVGGPK